MKELPDFVLPYKTKGHKIKEENGKYYLYKVSSHREPGRSYPVATSEYLGTVTRDGLVKSHPPVNGKIEVYRYGTVYIANELTKELANGFGLRLRGETRPLLLFVVALLHAVGEAATSIGYETSYISVMYPRQDVGADLTDKELQTLDWLDRQVTSRIRERVGPDWDEMEALSSHVYAVHVNGKWMASMISDRLKILMETHGILFSLKEEAS